MSDETQTYQTYNGSGKALEMLEHIGSRKAGRRLTEQPIGDDALLRILEAARWAPSCSNKQPWRYRLCTGADAEKIREALLGGNYWADSAPAYIVAAVDRKASCNLSDDREYALLDLGLSMQNIFLQAHAEGLVAHPMAGMDPFKVKELFGIQDNFRVMAVISLAYPGGDRELSDKHEELEQNGQVRKPMKEILFNPEILDSLNG